MATLTDERLDEIEKAAQAATPGPWQMQDSCSWRRIGGVSNSGVIGDGNVIRPTKHPRDGWPDLEDSTGGKNLKFITMLDPTTVLSLVAQARRNRRVEEAAKLVVTAWEFGLAVPYGTLRTALKETADANC